MGFRVLGQFFSYYLVCNSKLDLIFCVENYFVWSIIIIIPSQLFIGLFSGSLFTMWCQNSHIIVSLFTKYPNYRPQPNKSYYYCRNIMIYFCMHHKLYFFGFLIWSALKTSLDILFYKVNECLLLVCLFQHIVVLIKVHIFWEGYKILRNLHLTFDCSTHS